MCLQSRIQHGNTTASVNCEITEGIGIVQMHLMFIASWIPHTHSHTTVATIAIAHIPKSRSNDAPSQ